MDAIQTVRTVTVAWLLFAISPPLFADAAGDATQAINDINTAQSDAAANVPTTSTAQRAEDRLDTAARNADDARATNNATQADSNATQAQKDATKRAADDAQAAESEARETADAARGTSNDPGRAQRYREALERRREARQRLRRAEAELRRALGNERRYGLNPDRQRAIEDLLHRAQRALSTSQSSAAMASRTGGEGALASKETGKDIGKNVARDATRTGGSPPTGGGISSCNPPRPACGGR